jgi:hypothetical protein
MTVNYKLDAMLEIRKFLWAELVSAGIFDPLQYSLDGGGTTNPILPVQQPADMNQLFNGKKHIIYDKINISYEDNWMICNDQILFTVYSTNISEINEITNFMIDLFRRMDDSAKDVNGSPDISTLFKFFSTYIVDISPTTPSKEMSGFYSSDIILQVKYSRMVENGRYI